MNLDLVGQTAVIVGGARGIGAAIAAGFAAEKANLALIDLAHDVCATAKMLQDRFGVQTLSILADVTNSHALEKAAQDIRAAWQRIDHVIFAVGIGSGKYGFPFWNLKPEDWGKVLEVNVIGAVNVAHAFTPALIDARRGTLLFLASVAGQIGSQTDPPYSASKAALINFAQCAAKDLAPYNVRVNSLCPGMVKTALNRSIWEAWNRLQPPDKQQSYDEWAEEKIRRVVPLGRWQTAEDIAAMAVFLASDRASNVTGQTINVDGGFVMHW
jgi:NAD(P)-dependent dehydrogenase (short-subunit alcohol dehydrogenase family)